MKGETDFNRQMQARPNETKLKTGSYCFLATLAFQEAKAKQEGKQVTTLRSYITERF
jgi:hypothetical protein